MVYVETNSYVAAHGKNPRGFGGWWFLLLTPNRQSFGEFNFTGLYGEAKKQAVAKAREVGASTVKVLS